MNKLSLLDVLPEGYEKKYQPFIYNSASFLEANSQLPQIHFYWVSEQSKQAYAHIAFNFESSTVYSPFKAPFGGIEVSSLLNEAELQDFLSNVENTLQNKQIDQVNIHQCPESYQKNDIAARVLKQQGYTMFRERVYHGIPINGVQLKEQMTSMQQRRLRKCEKAGFEFRKVPESDMAEVFKQIHHWRELNQKPLSLSWADFENSQNKNPNTYLCFGVYDKHLIAATIVVKVNDQAIYHFFPASDERYNQYSPMVMLVNGIYEWGQVHDFKLLDLGTSYLQNEVNQSLVSFKERLGGRKSLALSWRKTLS